MQMYQHSVRIGWIISQLRLQSSKEVNTFSSIQKQHPFPIRKPAGMSCSGLQERGALHRQLPWAVRSAVVVAEPQRLPLPDTSLPFSLCFLSQVILPLTRHRELGAFPLVA